MNAFAVIGIRLLEAIFAIGVAGAAVVVLLTFVEDLEVWSPDNPADATVAEGSAVQPDDGSAHPAY